MKSVVEIEQGWYEDDFCQLYQDGREILDYNELPNPQCPFDPLYKQQAKTVNSNLDISYSESQQVMEVYQNLNDSAKASVIAGLSEEDWLVYQTTGVLNGYLQVPPDKVDERQSVSEGQKAAIAEIRDDPLPNTLERVRDILGHKDEYQVPASNKGGGNGAVTGWFWSPRGEVIFAVGGEAIEIPTWPESVKDSIGVSWSQEMTTNNHYEPVNTFKNSGPRVVSCTFKLHRAMWTGDESDDCENLVALMESACYPDYQTQAAEPPECCLIIGDSIQIVGIMTAFEKTYQGPISEAVKYDEVIISVSITEVSQNVLSSEAVKGGLAGVR